MKPKLRRTCFERFKEVKSLLLFNSFASALDQGFTHCKIDGVGEAGFSSEWTPKEMVERIRSIAFKDV